MVGALGNRLRLLRLLTKKCKHFFVSLRSAEPMLLRNITVRCIETRQIKYLTQGELFYLAGALGRRLDVLLIRFATY